MSNLLKLIFTGFLLVGCASQGVIGVVYNQRGIVRSVFSDSPAEKAGIRADDQILNFRKLRGKVGSMCLVKVTRAGTYFEKLIKRIDEDKLQSW